MHPQKSIHVSLALLASCFLLVNHQKRQYPKDCVCVWKAVSVDVGWCKTHAGAVPCVHLTFYTKSKCLWRDGFPHRLAQCLRVFICYNQ